MNSEDMDAKHGADALMELRHRATDAPPDQLFKRIVAAATADADAVAGNQRFWLGTAFGGAVAASLFAIALFFGWGDNSNGPAAAPTEFIVALGETRLMNLAFETDRPLYGAQISIVLLGDVEIQGYGLQRELAWPADLDAGLNSLSLPVIANGLAGGQMVVRLSHPLSEQVLVIRLPTES